MLSLLPHYEKASVSIDRLRGYVLNLGHPKGKHKARVFKSVLAIEHSHAEQLAKAILFSLPRSPAIKTNVDEFGERWQTYHEIVGVNGQAAIVSVAWILRPQSPETPELVTCYIDSKGQDKVSRLVREGRQ